MHRYKNNRRKSTKATFNDLPNEMLVKIFSYLDVGSLMNVACVCQNWSDFSESTVLWRSIYFQHLFYKLKASRNRFENINNGPCLKKEILSMFRKIRDKKFLPMIKRSAYTGVTDRMDQLTSKLGVTFQLCLENGKDEEAVIIVQSRRKVFNSSTVIQWHSLSAFPPFSSLSALKIYACTPMIYDRDNKPVPNGPTEKKLVFEERLKVGESVQTMVSDETISLHITNQNITIAVWKDTDEIAFVVAGLHNHNLTNKCLLSTANSIYCEKHEVKLDDVDNRYGFHGYDLHIHLHTFGLSLWDQKFSCLFSEDNCSQSMPGFVEFSLAQSPVKLKTSQLKWRTEVFSGAIKNATMVDVSLTDCNKDMFWSWSRPLFSFSVDDKDVSLENGECDNFLYQYNDEVGCLKILVSRAEKEVKLERIVLFIKITALNQWFGTNHLSSL